MQIYTKILIGMGVGAVIGITVGPKSSFLPHDTYKVVVKHSDCDPEKTECNLEEEKKKINLIVLRDASDPKSLMPLPDGAELRLKILETTYTKKTDDKNQEWELPDRSRVSFEFDKKLGLLAKDEKVRKALGDPKIGDRIEGWLIIEHTPLGETGGFLVSPAPISGFGDTVITWISPVGDLFMRLIKMVIVPLVFASLLCGVAGLGDIRKLGRMGGKTLLLYLGTTACAVTIGLGVAHLISPGDFIGEKDRAALVKQFEGDAGSKVDAAAEAPSLVENILSIIPTNPIESLSSGNMLQVIFFALIFGIALTMIKEERAQEVVRILDTVQEAMILIIHMVMAIAPFGVAALIANVVGQSGLSVLGALLVYGVTVIIGLLLLAGLVYGSLVKFVARLPIIGFLKGIRPAQLIAFSTSSSSAALPVTLECAEENLGVSKSTASFVIPLGSTVNMDGTALYQGVAAIFIAQVFGIDLSIGDQLGIVFAATAASIGAAGVPGAGMITLAMVLTSAGIPPVGVALILGIDRLLDMFRTMVNVTGDLAVTSVMAVSEGETLRVLSIEQDAKDPDRGFENRLDHEQHSISPDEDDD